VKLWSVGKSSGLWGEVLVCGVQEGARGEVLVRGVKWGAQGEASVCEVQSGVSGVKLWSVGQSSDPWGEAVVCGVQEGARGEAPVHGVERGAWGAPGPRRAEQAEQRARRRRGSEHRPTTRGFAGTCPIACRAATCSLEVRSAGTQMPPAERADSLSALADAAQKLPVLMRACLSQPAEPGLALREPTPAPPSSTRLPPQSTRGTNRFLSRAL